jgi:hypothetical protein
LRDYGVARLACSLLRGGPPGPGRVHTRREIVFRLRDLVDQILAFRRELAEFLVGRLHLLAHCVDHLPHHGKTIL